MEMEAAEESEWRGRRRGKRGGGGGGGVNISGQGRARGRGEERVCSARSFPPLLALLVDSWVVFSPSFGFMGWIFGFRGVFGFLMFFG
jgi:hypothetical protein